MLRLTYACPLDLAVLQVAAPYWTRRNRFVVTPDARPYVPLSEAIVAFGYLSRLMSRVSLARQARVGLTLVASPVDRRSAEAPVLEASTT